MPNSTVTTDLVANDKVTEAVNKAAAGVNQYANQSRVKLEEVRQSFERVNQSAGNLQSGLFKVVSGTTALTSAMGSMGLAGVSSQALAAVRGLTSGLQALTKAQVVLQALGGPGGWSMLAIGVAAAVGAVAFLSSIFEETRDAAIGFGDALAGLPGRIPSPDKLAPVEMVTRVKDQAEQLREYEKMIRRAAEEIDRVKMAGSHAGVEATVMEELTRQLQIGIKGRFGIDLRPFVQQYNEAIKPFQELLESGALSAEQFATQQRKIQDSLGAILGPMERYRRSLASIADSHREGRLTAEALQESLRKLTESQFGPLLTEGLQAKLNRQFADIERDFSERFGRKLTPAQAAAEREARREAAVRGVTGAPKSPEEQLRETMGRAAVARGAGQGEAAGRMERDAQRAFSRAIMDAARERQGLTGPFAGLATDAERLRAELKAIQEAGTRGAFGAAGSAGATEIQRRHIVAALEQYGRKVPEIEKPQWEGLTDTWRRIQQSVAGQADNPQERAAKAAEANQKVLMDIFGESKQFNAWLQKWYEKKEDSRARAG